MKRVALFDISSANLNSLKKHLELMFSHEGQSLDCVTFEQIPFIQQSLAHENFSLLIVQMHGSGSRHALLLLQWLREQPHISIPYLIICNTANATHIGSTWMHPMSDYIIKPVRLKELYARVQRLIDIAPISLPAQVATPIGHIETFGAWVFNSAEFSIQPPTGWSDSLLVDMDTNGKIILTEREFCFALTLFRNMGQPVSRQQLLVSAGYVGQELPSRTLDSHIYRLRLKLGLKEERGIRLQTVYGLGYRLELIDEEVAS